jgi:dienelactone hydrolase
VFMPSLFGVDGAMPGPEEGVAIFRRACVSAEFKAFAANEASPVTQWLRTLARVAHQDCGGPGVGAIGMCFTGNFSLSMMLEPAMLAPVMCQPSLPIDSPEATGLSEQELFAVRQRLERDDLNVLAFRFEGDKWCRAQRFEAFERALGKSFITQVLPANSAEPQPAAFYKQVVETPHSVVTAHLIDEAGQPTIAARDEILAFFTRRLYPGAGPATAA